MNKFYSVDSGFDEETFNVSEAGEHCETFAPSLSLQLQGESLWKPLCEGS